MEYKKNCAEKQTKGNFIFKYTSIRIMPVERNLIEGIIDYMTMK